VAVGLVRRHDRGEPCVIKRSRSWTAVIAAAVVLAAVAAIILAAGYLGHRSLVSTERYTALTPVRFMNFWKD
jgi:hypothetical protein